MTVPLQTGDSFLLVAFFPEILKVNTPESFLYLSSKQAKQRKGKHLPESGLVWATENLGFSQVTALPVFCVNKNYLQARTPGRNIGKKEIHPE